MFLRIRRWGREKRRRLAQVLAIRAGGAGAPGLQPHLFLGVEAGGGHGLWRPRNWLMEDF